MSLPSLAKKRLSSFDIELDNESCQATWSFVARVSELRQRLIEMVGKERHAEQINAVRLL